MSGRTVGILRGLPWLMLGVTDFVRHKTIVLHAGQSYLAKASRR